MSWLRSALAWLSHQQPAWAARLAEVAFTLPRRYERPARERALLARGRPERLPFGAGELSAWSWGAGPTVVLVHGWESRGAQLGALVDPLVAAGFRVVAYDAPAHGDSPGRQATLVSFTEALMAAVRHFGPVHGVVAHSFGGAAVSWAAASGLSMGRVALLSPNDVGFAVPRYCRWLGLGPEATERLIERVIERVGAPMGRVSARALAPGLTAPALVIHDTEDRFVPFGDGQGIARAWPGARLVTTEGLGHHRILRDEAVVREVVGFLEGGPLPAA